MRSLFMQQPGGSLGGGEAAGGEGSGVGSFAMLCKREQAHPLDINCVRWHPTDPGLLASAGDDCCIKLWRWRPDAC